VASKIYKKPIGQRGGGWSMNSAETKVCFWKARRIN
jgi:hypothetical protein